MTADEVKATPVSQGARPSGFVTRLLATFFFSGHLPKAPGTWASGFTAIILFFVWPQAWYVQFLLLCVVYFVGVWLAGLAEKYYGYDGRPIVIDEVVGQMVALFMAPKSIIAYVLAFGFFRLFDIVKPPPARQWEDLVGGWGVVADDVAAGVYAAVIMQFLLVLLGRWEVRLI